jgi:hypothetical protein
LSRPSDSPRDYLTCPRHTCKYGHFQLYHVPPETNHI